MTNIAITAEPRDEFGKGAARRLRREGRIPAVIYGHDTEVKHVSLPGHELDLALVKPRVVLDVELDGTVVTAAPRQIQRDPVRRIIEHLDLVVLSKAEARERDAEGALIVLAEAAAVEEGLDAVSVAEAAQAAVDSGVKPADAIAIAVAEVKAHLVAQAETNVATEAAEEAAAEAAAEPAAAESGDEG